MLMKDREWDIIETIDAWIGDDHQDNDKY